MVAPRGAAKNLTFHIAPFVLDFYKHCERDVVETVCLVNCNLISEAHKKLSALTRVQNTFHV